VEIQHNSHEKHTLVNRICTAKIRKLLTDVTIHYLIKLINPANLISISSLENTNTVKLQSLEVVGTTFTKVKFLIMQEIPHTKHNVIQQHHDQKTVNIKLYQNTQIYARRQTCTTGKN